MAEAVAQQQEAARLRAREDEDWLAHARRIPAGRSVCDYVERLSLHEAAIEERRPTSAFVNGSLLRWRTVRALQTRPRPFGLSDALPKCLVVFDDEGSTKVLSSERFVLVERLACSHVTVCAERRARVTTGVREMIAFVRARADTSLLLVYVRPFMADGDAVWWELRTLRRTSTDRDGDADDSPGGGHTTRRLLDGELVYGVDDDRPRTQTPTDIVLISSGDDAHSAHDGEVARFVERNAAVDLDGRERDWKSEGLHSASAERLLDLLATLRTERTKLLAQHRQEASDHAAELTALRSRNAELERDAHNYEETMRATKLDRRDVEHNDVKLASLSEALRKVNHEIKFMKAEHAGKELQWDEERKKHTSRLRTYAVQRQQSAQKLWQLTDALQRERDEATVCAANLQTLRLELRSDEERHDYLTASATRDAARRANEVDEMRSAERVARAELESELEAAKEALATTDAATRGRSDRVDCEVQTCGMSKEALELGEAQSAYARLRDELDASLSRERELRAKVELLSNRAASDAGTAPERSVGASCYADEHQQPCEWGPDSYHGQGYSQQQQQQYQQKQFWRPTTTHVDVAVAEAAAAIDAFSHFGHQSLRQLVAAQQAFAVATASTNGAMVYQHATFEDSTSLPLGSDVYHHHHQQHTYGVQLEATKRFHAYNHHHQTLRRW